MPPRLALLITIGVIILLIRRDSRQKSSVSGSLWLPVVWMLIIGSRFLSQWLATFGLPVGGASIEDGSPLDALLFFGLIVAGIEVLRRRRVRLGAVIRSNVWLSVFLGYCFLAIFWSDFPFVAFKRWIKVLGHPIMALVVLTERDPLAAVTALMKRSAYVLVTTSVLVIKYFPEVGREFSEWTGAAVNVGVTIGKNLLGSVCMAFGCFFWWHLMRVLEKEKGAFRRSEAFLCVCFLYMIGWLLWMSASKTSLGALAVGMLTMIVLRWRFVSKRHFGALLVGVVLVAFVAEGAFGIYAGTLELLGKDPTLTDRTLLWEEVLKVDINPILGAGFESFWLGERYDRLASIFSFRPNQAHNGYIEVYLNLGWVGVLILTALILGTFWKVRNDLLRNFQFGQFCMGCFIFILIYNYTEATFKALHFVWFVFYLVALEYPRLRRRIVAAPSQSGEGETVGTPSGLKTSAESDQRGALAPTQMVRMYA